MAAKFILGTAQLGMPYGIANQNGKPSGQQSTKILKLAVREGISIFDTAPSYGSSEQIIGGFLSQACERVSVSTKLPSVRERVSHKRRTEIRSCVHQSVTESLQALNKDTLEYYLLHDEMDLQSLGKTVLDAIQSEKEKGNVQNIGLSAYSPEIVRKALKLGAMDVLQVPINLFDNRFETVLKMAKMKDIQVFARSIFLQGLFFLSPSQAEDKVPGAGEPIRELNSMAREMGRPIAEIAVSYVRDKSYIDGLVIGVETVEQLKENLRLMEGSPIGRSKQQKIQSSFADLSPTVFQPTNW